MDHRNAILILGLPADASPSEVEEAYARRVREVQRVAAQAPTAELRSSCLQTLEELERARLVASDPRYRPTGRTQRPQPAYSREAQRGPSARMPVASESDDSGDTTDTMAESDTSDLEGVESFRLAADVGGFREDFQLTVGTFRIGRAPENDLTVDDSFFSRHHCEIVVEAGRATLFDLQSTNGTLVNSRPVSQRRLRPGDSIQIGTLQAVFRPGERAGIDRFGLWISILVCALVGGLLLGFFVRAQRQAPGSWWRWAARLHAVLGESPPSVEPPPVQPTVEPITTPPPVAAEPRIELHSPGQEDWLNVRSVWLRGRVHPRAGFELTIAERFIAMDEDGVFAAEVDLPDEHNRLRLVVATLDGEPQADLELLLHVDTTPPELRLVQPSIELSNQTEHEVRVWASDETRRVQVQGEDLAHRGQGIYTSRVVLSEGAQVLHIEAWDRAGNRARIDHPLHIDTTGPQPLDVQMHLLGDSVRAQLQADEEVRGFQSPGGNWRSMRGDRLACLVSFAQSDTLELRIRDAAGNVTAVALHHALLADAYLQRAREGAGDAAIADLERCLELRPARLDVELELDRLLFEVGRPEQAFARLEEALRRWPDEAALWELSARRRRAAGLLEEALQDFARLQQLEPERGAHWAVAGALLLELGEPEAGRQKLEEAVRRGFGEAWLWEALAPLREQAGQLQEALAGWYALRAQRPADAPLSLHCAELENQLGREVDAMTLLDQAIELDASLLQAFVLRAEIRIRHNRLQGALADCNAALALDPACAAAWGQRAQVHSLQGQLAQALADAGQVIELAPSADAYNARAAVALALRQYSGAESDCQRALQLDPEHALALHNLERARRGLRGE